MPTPREPRKTDSSAPAGEPTEQIPAAPTQQVPATPPAQPPAASADVPADPPAAASAAAPVPSQPAPSAPPTPGASAGPGGPQGPGVPPGGPVGFGVGGPAGPGGPSGPGGPGGVGGPPPRKPGMWKEATSTTGGRVAVAVAAALVAVAVVGVLAFSAMAIVRGVAHHDRSERIAQARDRAEDRRAPGRDDRMGPGMRDRMPSQGNGNGNGRGNGFGNGFGRGDGSGTPQLGGVQHGEFTAPGSDGKSVTMLVQRGEVTKVDSGSLTVKSADGFTATYARTSDTRVTGQELKTGASVVVLAQKDGAKATWVRVQS